MPPLKEWDSFPFDGERWRLGVGEQPPSIPMIALLYPREHFGESGDLPDELAAELGILASSRSSTAASWRSGKSCCRPCQTTCGAT